MMRTRKKMTIRYDGNIAKGSTLYEAGISLSIAAGVTLYEKPTYTLETKD